MHSIQAHLPDNRLPRVRLDLGSIRHAQEVGAHSRRYIRIRALDSIAWPCGVRLRVDSQKDCRISSSPARLLNLASTGTYQPYRSMWTAVATCLWSTIGAEPRWHCSALRPP